MQILNKTKTNPEMNKCLRPDLNLADTFGYSQHSKHIMTGHPGKSAVLNYKMSEKKKLEKDSSLFFHSSKAKHTVEMKAF